MKSVYAELLSTSRFRESEVSDRHIMLEAESDRGRLLFCPAFRRLQQKAQVFSMESNAAVRSRLTHSFEVSQIGRYLSDQISLKLISKGLADQSQCAALTTFVETACLMHDIGNPPFGHFGESAISEWFRLNGGTVLSKAVGKKKKDIKSEEINASLNDFFEFDGNPQGLRIVTKLQRNSDEYGLNLTKTTIASYLKYIRSSNDKADKNSPFTKKCGYFSTEIALVKGVWEEFGYEAPQRFPLAYIMEAADDIAYCISDLEDSIEKGLLNKELALREIRESWKGVNSGRDKISLKLDDVLKNASEGKRPDGRVFTFIDFRTNLNRIFVEYAAEQYVKNHREILAGSLPSLILSESPCGRMLESLKSYCRNKVYCHESVQRIELAGYHAIYGLLQQFSCLLSASKERFTAALNRNKKDEKNVPIIVEGKLLTLFPKNYILSYKENLEKVPLTEVNYNYIEWNLRAHLVVDFISGMTDDFATTTYQSLSGMKL